MKTLRELREWCEGARKQFGDPSEPVCQLFFRWVEVPPREGDELVCRFNMLEAWFNHIAHVSLSGLEYDLPISEDGPIASCAGELEVFGVERIAPGMWSLTPSLNAPGVIHAFIVLYGLPEPAPWETFFVLPTTAERRILQL